MIIRQGDVLCIPCDSIPPDAEPIKRDKRGVVLAEGEATGHAHVLRNDSTVLYRVPQKKARHLHVVETDYLKHEEHSTHAIPPGLYRVVIQTEYRDKEIVRVAD